ncbi:SDR family oxidoreductase [Parvibaculum sp.]|uniref:SDR family NAD(P)-dependent oxidoreductase n=1 Tax=Parvibaculum sp. TaxID=2024848 RepID=UPI0032110B05
MNDLLGLMGKKVLVTGASRGIGYGIAAGFVEAGAELSILADDAGVHDAAKRLGGAAVRSFQCDVRDRAAVAAIFSDFGPLDVLINNAGLELITPLDDFSLAVDEIFERILAINVTGTWNVTRAALPLMGQGGRIVNTASVWGKSAVGGFAAYIASKHAVIGLTRTFARELGPRGINVNAVCPGWVRTEASLRSLKAMSLRAKRTEDALLGDIHAGQALPGLMNPDDVAGLYVFLASKLAANITGQAIGVDRGEFLG